MLLFAAGEAIDGSTIHVPDFLLFEDQKLCLMQMCRGTIRKHLLHLNPQQHLFLSVPRLGLPKSLQDYVLYNQTLDCDDDDCDNDNDASSQLLHRFSALFKNLLGKSKLERLCNIL